VEHTVRQRRLFAAAVYEYLPQRLVSRTEPTGLKIRPDMGEVLDPDTVRLTTSTCLLAE
jgi:hypothetical protein